MKLIHTYEQFIFEEEKAGGWAAIMRGVKSGSGSGPWCLVAIQEWVDGKRAAVVGQELVNTKEAIPAAYEGFKRQYPKAHIHIENAGGQTVWSEKK
jgi:hypothetical protein